jgi:hypothetical protein
MRDLAGRIGSFVIVIGLGILLLFILSELADAPDFDYLFMATLVLGLGWMLRRQRLPVKSSGRFAWLRQRRSRGRDGNQQGTSSEDDEVS